MSRLSSWLKKRGGKVGEIANKVGKVLPSTGQFIGGAMLGPIGQVVGGRVDPYTSDTQTKIGDAAAAATVPAAIPHVLPKGAPIPAGTPGTDPTKPTGEAPSDGFDWSKAFDFGLGAAGLVNAANLSGKSDKFADRAYADVNDSYDARAPLRSAGIAGMMNPSAGVPLKMANVDANTGRGNPFAVKPGVRSAGVPFPPTAGTPGGAPLTERDVFALGDPKRPALPKGTKEGIPPTKRV